MPLTKEQIYFQKIQGEYEIYLYHPDEILLFIELDLLKNCCILIDNILDKNGAETPVAKNFAFETEFQIMINGERCDLTYTYSGRPLRHISLSKFSSEVRAVLIKNFYDI